MRINRYLASCGVGSRRAAEGLVEASRVSVNGKTVTDLGTQIAAADTVTVDGKIVKPEAQKVYIAFNKPKGCVTTCSDDKGRKTVLDVIGDVGARVFPIGRLDYETEGLLILTNDGDFARYIMHPSSEIKKIYVATVDIIKQSRSH